MWARRRRLATASIFERIPKPQSSPESLELFAKLASPEDVPLGAPCGAKEAT